MGTPFLLPKGCKNPCQNTTLSLSRREGLLFQGILETLEFLDDLVEIVGEG